MIRYLVRYRIAISGYKDIEGKNFDVVHNIGAMSRYKEIKVFSSISKILSISGTICHIWGGWAHRPRYTGSPGPVDGSNLLVLDSLGRSVLLGDCLDALSCWSSATFCCCSAPALVWTAGRSRWAVLISSYHNTSDLVMMHMMSVEYAFSLSWVFCLDPAGDASVLMGHGALGLNQPGNRPLTDTAGPQLPEACRLMTWRQDRTRSCQATGNNNPGTPFSAIAKKLKLISSYLQSRLLWIKTLRRIVFGHLFTCYRYFRDKVSPWAAIKKTRYCPKGSTHHFRSMTSQTSSFLKPRRSHLALLREHDAVFLTSWIVIFRYLW